MLTCILYLMSLCRPQTRLRVDPTTTANNKKYDTVLAAIATSSPKDQATKIRTTSTNFPNIPDFDTPYLLTLQDSKAQSNSRQASSTSNTNSRKSNSQLPKSRRIALTQSFSLAEPYSTAKSKPSQPSRSRSSSRRIFLDSSTELVPGRQDSEVVTLGAPLSGTYRSGSQSASPRSIESDDQHTTTKSFKIGDNASSTSKAFSLEDEISGIENSFTLNNGTSRRGEERGRNSFKTDTKISTKSQNQIQRGASEPVQRTRLVSETASSPSDDLNTSQEPPSSQRSALSSRTIPQSRQTETHSTSGTPRSSSQNAGSETALSPSAQISTSSQQSDSRKEPNPTPPSSALRSFYEASLVEADDVNSGLSRNSIVQQSDVSINNRARSRGSSQRKPTSCADAVDTNSNAGCNEKLQIRYIFNNSYIRQ